MGQPLPKAVRVLAAPCSGRNNKYLDCGDLHQGFARVKCNDCNHEYLLPFSCKRRSFCPTCHQKRVVEFGEHLHEEVLEDVTHRQWVFSLPKRLRPYFMYDRKLLPKLSLCAWNVLSEYLKTSVSKENSADKQAAGKACCSSMQPGCVIAVQTFGEFLNFNPHLHIIATDGCFHDDRRFIKAPYLLQRIWSRHLLRKSLKMIFHSRHPMRTGIFDMEEFVFVASRSVCANLSTV